MMVNTKWSSWQGDFKRLVTNDWVIYKVNHFYVIVNRNGHSFQSVFTRLETCIDYCDWFVKSKPRLKYRKD